jgi:hypothetical protein
MATKKDGVPLLKKGTMLNPNKTVDVKMTSRELDPKTGLLGKQKIKEKSVTKSYKNLLGNPVEKTKRKVVVTGVNGKSKFKSTTSNRSFTNPITGVKTEKKVSKETGSPRMVVKTKSNVSTPGKGMKNLPNITDQAVSNKPGLPAKTLPKLNLPSPGLSRPPSANKPALKKPPMGAIEGRQEGPQSVAPTSKAPVLKPKLDPRGSVSLQKNMEKLRNNNSDKSNKNSRYMAAGLGAGAGAAPFKKKTN